MANAYNDDDARRLVREYRAQGVDFTKIMRMARNMYFVIAAEARRLGIPFGGHAAEVTVSEASDSGASIIDHLHFHSQELLTDCFDPEATAAQCQPLGVFRLAHRLGLPILAGTDVMPSSPTAVHRELWAYAGDGLTPLEAL